MDSGKPFFFIGKITNAVSNFIGFALKPLSNVSLVNVSPAAAVLAKECLPNNGRPTRQTDAASGRYRAVVRTGAGVGSLEVRLSSHSDPRESRESRRPARVARNSGYRLVTA